MNIDLSICQEALNRDPVLYLDLTEAVRRGEGRLIAAMPRGALVSFRNYEKDGQELGFTMFAGDLETAKRLLAMLPSQPDFLTVHEDFYLDELEKRFGFDRLNPCWQVGYLRTMAPAAPDCGAEIRQLEPSHLPAVVEHYAENGVDDGYLSGLIEQGELYGAFEGETLMAFIGRHAEGSMGLLEVLPQYRRRGLGRLLQSHLIDLELSRGRVPYGQVFDGNEASLALQQSLGMTRSMGRLYWAVRND